MQMVCTAHPTIKRLEKLAGEVGAAFLDMETAWGKYVRDSGRELDSFKRDPVHANEQGEQILGHILANYLSYPPRPGQSPADQETDPLVWEKLDRFQDWKFGFMMHWGIYSQWGCIESWPLVEADKWARPDDLPAWIERGKDFARFFRDYVALNKTFNPQKFDPGKWVAAAKGAGMKYVVFTTKHHDGFCMFDTKQTDYRTTHPSCPFHTNPKADVVKEVFDTFRGEGFGIGAYYSKSDWHHPGLLGPRVAAPGPQRQLRHDEGSREMGHVREFHAQHRRGADDRLRPGRHPLARRRPGPPAAAGHQHAEAGRDGPQAPAGPDRRRSHGRRPLRELSHARAGGPREGPALRLGNLHDDGRPVVVQAQRQVQVHAAS